MRFMKYGYGLLALLLITAKVPATETWLDHWFDQPSHAPCVHGERCSTCPHCQSFQRLVEASGPFTGLAVIHRRPAAVCPPCPPCPPCPEPVPPRALTPATPGQPLPPATAPQPEAPVVPPPDVPDLTDPDAQPPIDDLPLGPSGSGQVAQAFGGSYGAPGTPAMIGDFFGGTWELASDSAFFDTSPLPRSGISVPIAGGDRRKKFAENNSPLPRDRLIFDYHHFQNPLNDINQGARDVDRFLFGFEKTFLGGLTSFELRIPFANGLDSFQEGGGLAGTRNAEFGNISTTFKALLTRGPHHAFAAGMMTSWPTGDDALFANDSGSELLIENEAIHLQPYLGLLITPDSRWFHQFFLQWDVDARGKDVRLFSDSTQGPDRATIQDQALMYMDYSVGYWLLRRPTGILRGFAPIFEVHYTTTLENIDPSPIPSVQFFDNRRDVMNVTGGIHLQFSNNRIMRMAVAAPVRGGTDKLFDVEMGLQFARLF